MLYSPGNVAEAPAVPERVESAGGFLRHERTDMETVNARISGTMLGIEDHGILTFFIYLEWPGAGQGLGGFALDQHNRQTKERDGWGLGFVAIRKILETVGVDKWESLPKTLVRLKVDGLGSSRPPIIGHILEDKWFDLKEFVSSQKRDLA
jgi:hypothetical protein